MKAPTFVLFDCPRCGSEMKAPLTIDGPFKTENGDGSYLSYLDVRVDVDAIRHRCSKDRPKGKPPSARPRSKAKRV